MIALLIAGLVWALGAVVGVGILDGIPRDEYEPGDRFFFGLVLTGLSLGCPLLCVIGYGTARKIGASRPRSFAIAQAVAAALATPVLVLLLR